MLEYPKVASVLYILFTLCTDDCRTDMLNQYILKYSDDTVLISVLNDGDSPGFHQQGVTKLVEWCENNDLVINTSKTEEIIFRSTSDTNTMAVFIRNGKIRQVKTYKYLGVMIDDILSWKDDIYSLCKNKAENLLSSSS